MRRQTLWLLALAPLATGCLSSTSARAPEATVASTPVTQNAPTAVPKVVGLPVLAATARLLRAGFAVTVPRFDLSSQTPQPVVAEQSPAAKTMLVTGDAVSVKLEGRCCIGSPAVSKTRALLMPNVVGQPLNMALQQVSAATGFYAVSIPSTTATRRPLLATYKVIKQWPRPGFDLRHQKNGFRLPQLTVAGN